MTEREKFEEVYRLCDLRRTGVRGDSYLLEDVQYAWKAWQARAKIAEENVIVIINMYQHKNNLLTSRIGELEATIKNMSKAEYEG